jgi:hypothetical protein
MRKIELARPSAQSLFIQMQFNGQVLSSGTAFLVAGRTGPILITNRHNVTGRHQETGQPLSKTGGVPNELLILHNQRGQLGRWLARVEPLYADDVPLWVEHPALKERADFVALPLTAVDDVEVYPYDPANPGVRLRVAPAGIVSVIGFPFGIRAGGGLPVWATGFYASEPDIDYADLPIFLIDCRTRPGQSGSPVIAFGSGGMAAMDDGSTAVFDKAFWRFLGIYSGRIHAESDLGIVWKASAIAELVATV